MGNEVFNNVNSNENPQNSGTIKMHVTQNELKQFNPANYQTFQNQNNIGENKFQSIYSNKTRQYVKEYKSLETLNKNIDQNLVKQENKLLLNFEKKEKENPSMKFDQLKENLTPIKKTKNSSEYDNHEEENGIQKKLFAPKSLETINTNEK